MLPSERMRAPDKSRLRTKTVRAWRCRACREIFDGDPSRSVAGASGRCPKCGASGSVFETRVRD